MMEHDILKKKFSYFSQVFCGLPLWVLASKDADDAVMFGTYG